MQSEMRIAKDSVKSLMKKAAKSKIKWIKSKEEKEQDNKQQVEKQQKKEEKEKRKREDKKRKLKERYEQVMMKQMLEEIEVSMKNANVEDRGYATPRKRTVSVAWDDTHVGNNSINEANTSRNATLFGVKDLHSANQNSRRGSLRELKTMDNGCKANGDIKEVTKNTQNSKNYMDEERLKRIAELFAAKEHNAAVLRSRASKANGLNTTGNGPKPESGEAIELNHNDSSNDGTDGGRTSVVRYTKTPLQTTEYQNHPNAVSSLHSMQKERMKKYPMRITEVDTCEDSKI